MKKKKPLLPVGPLLHSPSMLPSTSGEMLTGSSPLRGARAMDQSNDQIAHGRQDVERCPAPCERGREDKTACATIHAGCSWIDWNDSASFSLLKASLSAIMHNPGPPVDDLDTHKDHQYTSVDNLIMP